VTKAWRVVLLPLVAPPTSNRERLGLREMEMAGRLHQTLRQYRALEAGELWIDRDPYEQIVQLCRRPRWSVGLHTRGCLHASVRRRSVATVGVCRPPSPGSPHVGRGAASLLSSTEHRGQVGDPHVALVEERSDLG
jgi:hypothetical protein